MIRYVRYTLVYKYCDSCGNFDRFEKLLGNYLKFSDYYNLTEFIHFFFFFTFNQFVRVSLENNENISKLWYTFEERRRKIFSTRSHGIRGIELFAIAFR